MKTLKIAVVGMLAAACVSCASHKGSSSLGKTNNTTQQTPKVKSEEQLKAEREAAELAAEKKRREAEAAAQRAKADAEAKAAEVNAAAQKVLDDAKAKAEEEEARLAAEAKAREEKVTVVETKSEVDGRFYVIIGSFKRLENARAASEAVANQGYNPSIMENEDGLYRVAILNAETESTARKMLGQIKRKFLIYADAWLLIQKR